jgi:hypothetical protein
MLENLCGIAFTGLFVLWVVLHCIISAAREEGE